MIINVPLTLKFSPYAIDNRQHFYSNLPFWIKMYAEMAVE